MKKTFNKISFLISILFLNLISFSNAEIINNIEIIGNERIPNETVKMFTGVNVGDDVNESTLNDILKKVYDSNFFNDVKVSIDNQTLKIIVEESYLVENINITGPKADRIIEQLKKVLKVKARKSYNEILILEDKKNILNELKQLGYFFSKVDISIEELSDNKINLNYNIEMGEKAKIRKISFVGDKIFKDRKLRGVIVSEEYKFWKFISGKKYLNQNLLSLDERLLKNFYLNKGYYNVKINSSFAKLVNESEFELVYNINANQKFFFNDLSLKLPVDFDLNNFSNISKLFKDLKGKPYSLYTINKILDEIDQIVLDEEYKSTESNATENIVDNKINMDFVITEGEKYSVARINVLGNNITQENVIRNQLLIDEGDEFNSILATKSINNIKSLNIFESVNSSIIENEIDKTKTIEISVEEKATGEIMAGAGVGTDGSTVTFAVKENNYLGRGVGLKSELTISEETVKGQFSVTNPNFKNSDKSVYANIQSLETDRLKASGYKNNKTGFGFGTKFEYQDDLFLGIGQDSYFEKIETNSTASSRQKAQAGNFWDTFLNLDLDYDKRNQKYKTTEGFRSSYNVNIPIISENNTFMNSFETKFFTELYDKNISTLSIFLKSANSITGDEIKLSERLFVPSNKLRGFERGKVGPLDGNTYVGGNYLTTLNFTSTLPYLLEDSENVNLLFFLDVANLWGVDYDSSLDNNDNINSSFGIGVDFFSPIGPLTFSFAQPITKNSSDTTESFRFNIGTSF